MSPRVPPPHYLSSTIDTTENDRGALTVLDLAPDAIVIVELDGRVAYMNQAAGRLFQYDPDSVRGMSIESLMPGHVRVAHQHLRQAYTNSNIVPRPMGVGRPLTASRRDGSEFPADISLSPVAWEGRRCVAAAVRDVSARHEALQAIRTAHQSLATLVAASPVAIIACDSFGQVHEWNEAAVRLLGVPQTQAIGHRLNDVMAEWGEPLSALVTELARGAPIITDVPLTVQRDAVTRLELRVSTARLGHEISAGFLLLIADDSPRRRARAETSCTTKSHSRFGPRGRRTRHCWSR